jgi:hypothetical protein
MASAQQLYTIGHKWVNTNGDVQVHSLISDIPRARSLDFILTTSEDIKHAEKTYESFDLRACYKAKASPDLDLMWLLRLRCIPYKPEGWLNFLDQSCILWKFEI